MTAAAYVNGAWCCYSTTDGRKRHYLGCRHLVPASAVAHVTPEYVSPRRSGDGSTPIPVPPDGSGQLEPSPEPQGSGLVGQAR